MDGKRLINFVRGHTDKEKQKHIKKQVHELSETLVGEEVKAFYESVVHSNSEKLCNKPYGSKELSTQRTQYPKESLPVKVSVQRVSPVNITKNTNINGKRKNSQDLLLHSQNGDLQKVQMIIENDPADINSADVFGWTALMCAACSGSLPVVKYLVSEGANLELRNSKNETARQIAEKSVRLRSVAEYLSVVENEGHSPVTCVKEEIIEDDEVPTCQPFFCTVCKIGFSETSREEHERSTVHLFSVKRKKPDTMYHLPESNRGFQLMLKSGWDREKGLGPDGKGQKFPVKTILKQDREGFRCSSKQKKARITHFGPNDSRSVESKMKPREMKASTLSKRAMNKKEIREKRWERNLRSYMNMD